jgi:hypothetical protein
VSSAADATINFLEIKLSIWFTRPALGHRFTAANLIRHYSNPARPASLQPWAMGRA